VRQLGKFQLLKKIASGGMAEIHLAKQRGMEGFEKLVVIKTILSHLSSNEEFVQMFLHEARVAARLSHPNIVQIFDLGKVGSTYFIAMEYIQGENLRAITKAARKNKITIPLAHIVQIISRACEGLHYAHTKKDASGEPLNIVHRDISPQNILVSYEGMVKLVDFGIAKAATQYQETRSGVLKGKYSYMSPEQCQAKPLDGRSDIFSMGIVLWELATGKRLFKQSSELMILKNITEGEIPPPCKINKNVPAELEAIILKALEQHPEHRFQTARNMHISLEEFMRNEGLNSGSIKLGSFMTNLFKDKLENLRKIERAQAAGEKLESFLFNDFDFDSGSQTPISKSESSPSLAEQLESESLTPSDQALYPHSTSGLSRPRHPESVVVQKPKSNFLMTIIIILLLGVLGAVSYLLYTKEIGPATTPGIPDKPPVKIIEKGSIYVTSTPTGAQVLINGAEKGTTPCKIDNIESGKFYAIQVTKPKHIAYSTRFKLDDTKDVRKFHASLEKVGSTITKPIPPPTEPIEKEKAVFSLRSRPKGATFYLDGEPIKSKRIKLVPETNYTISARLNGYKEWSDTYKPTPGEKKVITARLSKITRPKKPEAYLTVNVKPWATVYVDGTKVGTSPINNYQISVGIHSLRLVNKQLGIEENIKFVAKKGEKVKKTFNFKTEKMGRLQIRAKPWAHVFINGKKIGTTPFEPKELKPGRYKVILKNPTLGIQEERTVDIKPGKTARLKINFLE
jgi:serine/threonine-protein kinase